MPSLLLSVGLQQRRGSAKVLPSERQRRMAEVRHRLQATMRLVRMEGTGPLRCPLLQRHRASPRDSKRSRTTDCSIQRKLHWRTLWLVSKSCARNGAHSTRRRTQQLIEPTPKEWTRRCAVWFEFEFWNPRPGLVACNPLALAPVDGTHRTG
jgi:hypothetical protein